MEDAAVETGVCGFRLEFALQLEADLDGFEGVRDGDGAAACDAAGDEGAGGDRGVSIGL